MCFIIGFAISSNWQVTGIMQTASVKRTDVSVPVSASPARIPVSLLQTPATSLEPVVLCPCQVLPLSQTRANTLHSGRQGFYSHHTGVDYSRCMFVGPKPSYGPHVFMCSHMYMPRMLCSLIGRPILMLVCLNMCHTTNTYTAQ